jgi:hypothetical protein
VVKNGIDGADDPPKKAKSSKILLAKETPSLFNLLLTDIHYELTTSRFEELALLPVASKGRASPAFGGFYPFDHLA